MRSTGLSRQLRRGLAALALVLSLPVATAAAQESGECADTALVLALDGSDSVDAVEYRFQRQAVADALRDREVLTAFAAAGTVTVSVIFWGDASRSAHHAGTVTVRNARDAELLARTVESQPRRAGGTTGLAAGLSAALDRIAGMGCSHRAVINVTGDGPETVFPRQRRASTLEQSRERSLSQGVTVNALVISGAAPGLAEYFARKVISGPEAFVMEVAGYADFRVALRKKLIREIAPAVISRAD